MATVYSVQRTNTRATPIVKNPANAMVDASELLTAFMKRHLLHLAMLLRCSLCQTARV